MRGQRSIDCIALYAMYMNELFTIQNMSRILTKLYHVRMYSVTVDFKPEVFEHTTLMSMKFDVSTCRGTKYTTLLPFHHHSIAIMHVART